MRLIRSLTPEHWESRQQCSLIRHPHLDEWIEKGRERGGYWRHPSTVLSHFRHSVLGIYAKEILLKDIGVTL